MTAYVGEGMAKGNIPLLVGVQTCIATLEVNMAVSQTIGNQPTSANLGHIP